MLFHLITNPNQTERERDILNPKKSSSLYANSRISCIYVQVAPWCRCVSIHSGTYTPFQVKTLNGYHHGRILACPLFRPGSVKEHQGERSSLRVVYKSGYGPGCEGGERERGIFSWPLAWETDKWSARLVQKQARCHRASTPRPWKHHRLIHATLKPHQRHHQRWPIPYKPPCDVAYAHARTHIERETIPCITETSRRCYKTPGINRHFSIFSRRRGEWFHTDISRNTPTRRPRYPSCKGRK